MRTLNQVMIILAMLVLIPLGIFAQGEKIQVKPAENTSTNTITRVEAKNVCMGMATNRVFARELIPAVVDGKTYYGCCEGCQSTLLTDPKSRTAIDPINKTAVDKATAVIGALPSGVVHYFESEETMHQFAELIDSKK